MDFDESWSNTVSSVGLAAREGNLTLLKQCVKLRRPIDASDNRGFRPIHEAAASLIESSYECLQYLISIDNESINLRTYEDLTPLALAVKESKSIEKIKLLLENGADYLASCGFHSFPLVQAINLRLPLIVKELLSVYKRNEVNYLDLDNMTPLHHASIIGDHELVFMLLQSNACIKMVDGDGLNAIGLASNLNHLECIRLLLEEAKHKGVLEDAINSANSDGVTPLFLASQKGYIECVSTLLEYNANPALYTVDFAFPLHAAIQSNHVGILKLVCNETILEAFTDLYSKVPQIVISPFNFCVVWRSDACLDYLLSLDIDKNKFPENISLCCIYDGINPADLPKYESALCVAAYHGYEEIVLKLINSKMNCNSHRHEELHPLCSAILGGSKVIIELLLNHGADINACFCDIPVCLQYALKRSSELFKLILYYGANPELCLKENNEWFVEQIIKKSKSEQSKILSVLVNYIGHCFQLDAFMRRIREKISFEVYNEISSLDCPLSLKIMCRNTVKKCIFEHLRITNASPVLIKSCLGEVQLPSTLISFVLTL